MSNPQLHPLEVNAKTGEPFLRLRRHSNIILTPPRLEDAAAMVPYHNDPRVCECLGGLPFPYTIDHANHFIGIIKPESDKLLKQLEDARDEHEPIIIGGCPVRAIREVHEDATDTFIGDIGLMQCVLGELMGTEGVFDWENKKIREEENSNRPVGDPKIIWSIGDFLAPSHHGRGIMTDAVGTVLHEWGVPRMAIRHMWVAACTGNEGSVKVFIKNGFKLIYTFEEHIQVRGKTRGVNILEWKYEA